MSNTFRITLMNKPLGRPPLPKGQTKQVFTFRLSGDEMKRVENAAAKENEKPREWARKTLLKAC